MDLSGGFDVLVPLAIYNRGFPKHFLIPLFLCSKLSL